MHLSYFSDVTFRKRSNIYIETSSFPIVSQFISISSFFCYYVGKEYIYK